MRILRVPLFLGAGGAVCLLGLASWFAGGGVVTDAVDLGAGDQRAVASSSCGGASVAIGLVALQSLLLGAQAISDAAGESAALLVAGVVLVAKAVLLPALLVVRRGAHA